ncbi:MAG: hypothetical protein WBP16_05430 [Ferruginibacter sp.]
MNYRIYIAYLFGSLFINACNQPQKTNPTNYIVTEKDLIPEGLAFDAATQTIYVSSTWKRKIVAIDKYGKISDFIKESQYGIKSVVGMEVDSKRNSLWAISSEANEVLPLKNPGELQWRSSVYQFDLSNGALIKEYKLNRDSIFLNDLCVADNGIVFVTETRQNAIYRIMPEADTIELFTNLSPYSFINGVCFTDKPGTIFASSIEGIVSVDLKTRNYSLLPVAAKISAGTVDGLSFHNNYFIAHQRSKIVRLYLSANRDSIIRSDTLDYGKEFDSSTTGEVWGNHYYYIINSQISSGMDYKISMIKPMDSLENIIIRKTKLSHE